jgi:hypothetical protein
MIPGPLHTVWIAEAAAGEALPDISDGEAGAHVVSASALELEAFPVEASQSLLAVCASAQLINVAVASHDERVDDCKAQAGSVSDGGSSRSDLLEEEKVDVQLQPHVSSRWYVWMLVASVILCWGGGASIYSVSSKYGSNSAVWTAAGLSFGMGLGYVGLALLTIVPKNDRCTLLREVITEVSEFQPSNVVQTVCGFTNKHTSCYVVSGGC